MPSRSLAVLLLLAAAAGAGFDAAEWQRAQRATDALADRPGEWGRKSELLALLRKEDSARVARLLVELAAPSAARREKLARAAADARKVHFRIDRSLRKKRGHRVTRDELRKNDRWRLSRDAYERAAALLEAEDALQEALGRAVGALASAEAVAVLVDVSDKQLVRARECPAVRAGIVRALWNRPFAEVERDLLACALDESMPAERARILDRIGRDRIGRGFDAAVAGLGAPETAVARAALAALVALDRPRCVPSLIAARRKASGLFADELDAALHRFTGQDFSGAGAGAMWAGWWRRDGETWLGSAGETRHEPLPRNRRGGAEFYGVPTRSDRIVFVLDRSGSMGREVPQGGDVSGRTRWEVARNQLARTIRGLARPVKFAVVFYSHDVQVWKRPPELVAATPANKRAAIDWFMGQHPEGSTQIFEALDMALRYAKVGGGKSATDPKGADTIFLLSDGAPTVAGKSDPLQGAALESAVKSFLDANRAYRCVVHTIGIGPRHNRDLMMRLARETGGTYKAVGVR